jgi:hypothetical protein
LLSYPSWQVTLLYRAMRPAGDGGPLIAPTARSLGVRSEIDILVDEEDDHVEPGTGGMSVAQDSPEHRARADTARQRARALPARGAVRAAPPTGEREGDR